LELKEKNYSIFIFPSLKQGFFLVLIVERKLLQRLFKGYYFCRIYQVTLYVASAWFPILIFVSWFHFQSECILLFNKLQKQLIIFILSLKPECKKTQVLKISSSYIAPNIS